MAASASASPTAPTPPDATAQRPTISFELMPPRNPAAAPKFWETARLLLEAKPDFVSVTYGAAGQDRATSTAVLEALVRDVPALPIAHLTCVGTTRDEMREVVRDFLSRGVRSFLALRGDPPADQPSWRPTSDGVASSVELVALLREVEAERCEQNAAAALRGAARPLTIAVAAFPGGNPAAGTSPEQEVARLRDKQDAGASFAITQLFYEPETYTGFVAAAREAGVTIPILAGLLPATDPTRLARVESLTGVAAPRALVADLERLTDPAERHARGVRASVELASAVLEAGAPGLHIYTFNQHKAALDLLEGVHLGGGSARPAPAGVTAPDLARGPWVVPAPTRPTIQGASA